MISFVLEELLKLSVQSYDLDKSSIFNEVFEGLRARFWGTVLNKRTAKAPRMMVTTAKAGRVDT